MSRCISRVTRVSVWLFLAFSQILLCLSAHAQASDTTVEVFSADEYILERPGACPTHVSGGLFGYFWGYEHAGYEWTDDWQRHTVLDPVNHALAEYVPEGGPYHHIVSRDGRASWYDPKFVARCTIRERWFMGRLVASDLRVKVVQNLGRVVPIGGGTGCGDARVDETSYDPYASSDPDCDDGDSTGGGGGGTSYQPGDFTGGETVDWATGVGNGGTSACGKDAKVEFVCIDIYDAATGEWKEWSCGYATTC
jgi:hypothetical protein